jgi:serine phosphatase RsbU (regulator of sigma subunit)
VQAYRAGPASFRTRVIEPVVPSIAGLDIYVAVLPKAEVAADFFEIVPLSDRLAVAIGDAPALGLKSAFVARFLGNLFRKMAQGSRPLRLDEVLTSLNARIQDQDYFQRVSMQCVSFEPRRGIMEIANAGHPYPVHYSARRGKCDILPVRGNLLHNPAGQAGSSDRYEKYSVETAPGDIVVLVTDGLTEGHVMLGDPYGYRFTSLVEANAMQSARTIGEAVLDDWRAHPREEDCADDVSIIVIGVRAGAKL